MRLCQESTLAVPRHPLIRRFSGGRIRCHQMQMLTASSLAPPWFSRRDFTDSFTPVFRDF